MKLITFKVVQNNKIVYVSGVGRKDAQEVCMNRYGFWPDADNMTAVDSNYE